MRNFKIEGIIVKRKNIGEADRILTVLTKTSGKIQVKAAGVRRITSRRSSHVELLNHVIVNLYKGRGMPLLLEAQTLETFTSIKSDLTKVGFAYHICELIDGLCAENQENKAVFALFRQTLQQLGNGNAISSIIHEFEIELLTQLGFYRKNTTSQINTLAFIESVLERRLKSKQVLPRLLQ